VGGDIPAPESPTGESVPARGELQLDDCTRGRTMERSGQIRSTNFRGSRQWALAQNPDGGTW
jgi:hypothetical protein